jgi:hypothetical protein
MAGVLHFQDTSKLDRGTTAITVFGAECAT